METNTTGAAVPALILDGGASPKARQARSADITPDQVERFLSTLAQTCNVTRSARAAGFCTDWAYRRRKKDAGFRNAWAEAVREGYAKLELVLLERAIKGTPKILFRRDGSERIVREYSTALAVTLLRRHGEMADSASYEHEPAELEEMRERILERLDRLREDPE